MAGERFPKSMPFQSEVLRRKVNFDRLPYPNGDISNSASPASRETGNEERNQKKSSGEKRKRAAKHTDRTQE